MNPKRRRRCEYCGEPLPTDNPLAKYCCQSCRTLAFNRRKKQEESNNLSGTETEPESEKIVLENFRLEKEEEPQEQKSEPVRNDVPQAQKNPTEKAKPQPKTFSSNKFSDFPQEDFSWLDDYDATEKNDTPVIHNTQPQEEKQFPTNDKHRKTKMPKGLSMDQQLAWEMTYGTDYGDANDFIDETQDTMSFQDSKKQNMKPETANENNPQGWKPIPFAEPQPLEVKPIYQVKSKQVYTPESNRMIEESKTNEQKLNRLEYEENMLCQIENQLQFNFDRVCLTWIGKRKELPDFNFKYSLLEPEWQVKKFDELLARGTLLPIGTGLNLTYVKTDNASHDRQMKSIRTKLDSYRSQIGQLKKRNAEIQQRLQWWEATMTVKENILTNKNEFENYQKLLEGWKQRKKLHDEKQIAEREEFIRQQERIQKLNEIPKIVQQTLQGNLQPKNPITTNEIKKVNEVRPIIQTPKPIIQTPKQPTIIQPTKQQRKLETNGLIVNSFDVHKYAEDVYPFDGRYGEFLGHLPVTFEMAVHGMPGQGKSFFCYRMAKHLADNYGRVIYIASEEGLGRTTEQKLADCKSVNLDLSNCRDLETIFQKVRKGDYKFMFLDSLKHLRINYEGYLELREHFSNEAIISIQQSTKAGEMAGEQSLKHEIDVEISVSDGYAVVGKTRALHGRSGLMFDIFPEDARPSPNEEVAVI